METQQGRGTLRLPSGDPEIEVQYEITDAPERWSGHVVVPPDAGHSARSEGQHLLVLEDGTECTIELLSEGVGVVPFRGVGPAPVR